MTRTRLVLPLALLLLLAMAATAGARPVRLEPPAQVEVGAARLGTSATGQASVLVPVRYPIQLAGQLVETRIALVGPGGGVLRSWVLHERVSSGRVQRPERRRAFTFVHRLDLQSDLARQLGEGALVRTVADARLDVNGDGKPELRSADRRVSGLASAGGKRPLCSSIPRLRVRPGQRISVPLPACDTEVEWAVRQGQAHGFARIRHGRLIYRAPQRFRGREAVELTGRRPHLGATASAPQPLAIAYAQVSVESASPEVVVRALGDSVTAGFGYYGDGRSMTLSHLFECRPPSKGYDDACSSNSLVTNNKQALTYAPDYGLSNNISWAAQWANEHGVTNFENVAVSGSAPGDWAPGGQFHEATERIENEDPDYVLMTMGANPLLSEMLFGVDNMGCAVYSQIFGGYSECIEGAFAEVHLRENLKRLYTDLVKHTGATIYLMQYHLSVPSVALAYSATQIAEMGQLLNREIAAVAAEVNPKRLQVVTPPHFNVGIDISPVYPSNFTCSSFGYMVDGPSVQSTPTQDELDVLHPLSFCEGPEGGGPPWVISGDPGIHPSAAGYAQMAGPVPPPQP
ncbi:MAG TPA: SGNH/GDSL hydrolase family protein [Solirubrobacterales bacterium]|nr:SGNH/GDSL hydrolase family protein [Solirubrobacterales bacterium]